MQNQENIKEEYSKRVDNYDTLGATLKMNIETLLKKEDIGFLSVTYRVKEIDSLIEKIERKPYANVFEDVEDFCGVRIICYYTTDLKKIDDIIEGNFEIIDKTYKESELGDDKFGYLSNHYIVKLKNDWCNIPINECCKDLKAEIQVRTILMHAWADISHKLNYKTENDSPKKLRRKLNQLSALFEIADGHFVELKEMKDNYRNESKKELENKKSQIHIETNLDSLQVLLDKYCVNYPSAKIETLQNTLEIMRRQNITINELSKLLEKMDKKQMDIISDEMNVAFNQNGIIRLIIALNYEVPVDDVINSQVPKWNEVVNKYKKKK